MDAIKARVQESWKAIVAFIVPLVVAAGADLFAAGEVAVEQINVEGVAWVTSIATSIGVWLKANKPS